MQEAKADEINALSELSLNLLRHHIPITMETVNKMRKHKNALRKIATRRDSVKKRHAVLIGQKGGSFWQGMSECLAACRVPTRVRRRR